MTDELAISVPDPPENPVFTSSTAGTSFKVSWSPPSVGSATGYFLTDDQGNTDTRLIPNTTE